MRIAVPITKIEKLDDGRLLVGGRMTDESADSQGDIMDYEGSKAAVLKWRGNVREAHDPQKPVGRALKVEPVDAERAIDVEVFVSAGAPDTQKKVLDKTLSFFSVGGSAPRKAIMEKRGDKQLRRVLEWDMTELSLVDVGANPNAEIRLVKADAATDQLAPEPEAPAPEAPPEPPAPGGAGEPPKEPEAPPAEPPPAPNPFDKAVDTAMTKAFPPPKDKGKGDPVPPGKPGAAAAPPGKKPANEADADHPEPDKDEDVAGNEPPGPEEGKNPGEKEGEGLDKAGECPHCGAKLEKEGMELCSKCNKSLKAAPAPPLTKADLDAAITERLADMFTLAHGWQLAEAIGHGLRKANDETSQALSEVKAEIGDLKAMRETLEKIARQPANAPPARFAPPAGSVLPHYSSEAVALLENALAATNSPDGQAAIRQQIAIAKARAQAGV